jgi:MerR family transcriptional regulator, light-induced transcriptional regulator
MPAIADLPDKPEYTIKVVCEQTGILPVTLRAWERRYGLVTPQRTSGNYRLYSQRDVALLRWVVSRLEAGASIGRVAGEYQTMRQTGQWPEAVAAPPAAPLPMQPERAAEVVQALYSALVKVNEAAAADQLRQAREQFSLDVLCLDIVQPCLYAIGEAWFRGAIRIATEHFASQFLRGQLLSLFQAYPMRHSAPRIVIGCAPDEFHDIGGLMLGVLLRQQAYRVEYLGADVQLEDLADFARSQRPALICLSANSEATARGLRRMDARLAGMRPRPRFGFGGLIFNVKPAVRDSVPGLFLGEDARQAAARIREILPL